MAALSWVLIFLFVGSGRDLAANLDAPAFWQSHHLEATAANLRGLLTAGGPKVEELKELAAALHAGEAQVRQDARQKLLAAGPAAVPVLEPLAQDHDPEVAVTARELLKDLRQRQSNSDEGLVRLMAIAELGRLKDREALPLLRELTAAKAPFEAEYAQRAIAAIEGKPAPARKRDPALAARLPGLVPAGYDGLLCLGAGFSNDPDATFAKLQETLPPEQRERMRSELLSGLVRLLAISGNLRVDNVVIAWSAETEQVLCLAQGEFDIEHLGQGLANLRNGPRRGPAGNAAEAAPAAVPVLQDGHPVYALDPRTCLVVLEPGLVVFASGGRGAPDLSGLLAAHRAGQAKLPGNEALAALVKDLPKDSPLWGGTLITPKIAQNLRWTSGFAQATLVAKLGDKGHELRAEGLAAAPESFQASCAEVQKGIDAWKQQLQATPPEGQPQPNWGPLADFAKSLTLTVGEGQATLTAALPDSPLAILGAAFFGVRMHAVAGPGGPRVANGRAMNQSRLRQVLVACIMFAADNGQTLPKALPELADKYLQNGQVLNWRHPGTGRESPFLYRAGLSTRAKQPAQCLVAAAPEAFEGKREVGFLDGHTELLAEPVFREQAKAQGWQVPGAEPAPPPAAKPELQQQVDALVKQLEEGTPRARGEARQRLAALGEDGRAALWKYRDHADPEVRLTVRKLLGQ